MSDRKLFLVGVATEVIAFVVMAAFAVIGGWVSYKLSKKVVP